MRYRTDMVSEQNKDRPLSGIRVLVTRAREQARELVGGLEALGAEVAVIPAVAVEPLPAPEGFSRAMARAGIYDNVIFTSVNGVEFTLGLLQDEGLGPRDLPPALCVGEKTAGAWEAAGGIVAAVPHRYTAEALLEALGEDLEGRAFLVMRPEAVRTELGRVLEGRGAEVDEVILYRTVTPGGGVEELDRYFAGGRPDVILFASPSAVYGVLKMGGEGKGILDVPAVCIGPTTAGAAEEAGFHRVYFPDDHTARGMVDELMVIAGGLREVVSGV